MNIAFSLLSDADWEELQSKFLHSFLTVAVISHVKHGVHPILGQLGEGEHTGEEYLEVLRKKGITHLVWPGGVSLPVEIQENLEELGFKPLIRDHGKTLYRAPWAKFPSKKLTSGLLDR